MRQQLTMRSPPPRASRAPGYTALRLLTGSLDAVAKLSGARLVNARASAVSATSERYLTLR
jgi:hypothetical protein